MMSKAAVAGAVIVIVAAVGGGGYYYVNQQIEKGLLNTTAYIKQEFPNVSVKYESHSNNVFSKSVTLNKVTVQAPDGPIYTADKVVLASGGPDVLSNLEVDNFHVNIKGDADIKVGYVDTTNFKLSPEILVVENGKLKQIKVSKMVFDTLNAKDITVTSPRDEVIKVAAVQIKNYGLDRKSDQTIQGIDIQPKMDKDFLKVTSLQVDGLGLAKVAQSIQNYETPNLAQGEPSLAKLDGVDAIISGNAWKLAKAESVRNIDANGNIQFTSNFSGAVIPVNASYAPALTYLKQLGYTTVEASGNVKADYSKEKSTWSIAPFALQVKDFGDVTVNTVVNGPATVDNNPMAAMSSYKLVSLSVNLQNQGLVKHVIDTMSKQTGKSETEATQELVKQLQSEADAAHLPIQKDLINAVIAVVNKPASPINIEVKPATPMALMEIGMKAQQNQVDDLHITVKN